MICFAWWWLILVPESVVWFRVVPDRGRRSLTIVGKGPLKGLWGMSG